MSALLTPQDALRTIPEFETREFQCEPLSGGLTNRTFLVTSGSEKFVLRLDDEHTRNFALNRKLELRARDNASRAGLAAIVLHSDIPQGIMLSEYLEGTSWDAQSLEDPRNVEAAATLLRTVHELPLLNHRVDGRAEARVFADNLVDRPGLNAFAEQCVQLIASLPVSETCCACHGDVVAENIVQSHTLKLLDWEYAADNDPMFDLASLIAFHNLAPDQADDLLVAYAGGIDSALREQLAIQIRLFDALQWLWHAVRHRISPDGRIASRLEKLQQRIR